MRLGELRDTLCIPSALSLSRLVRAAGSYATPRLLLSAVVIAIVAGLLLVQYLTDVLHVLAIVAVPMGVAVASAFTTPILFAVLLLRPLLGVIPDFEVAGESVGIDGVVNVLVVLAFTPLLLVRRPMPFRRPVFVVWCLFLVLLLQSLRLSSDPAFGSRQWFRFCGYFVFFLVAYTAAANRPDLVLPLRRMVVAIVGILAAMGAVQMALMTREVPLSQYIEMMSGYTANTYRLDGFQDYPHVFANMLMTCIPVVLWAAWTSRRRVLRLVYLWLAFGSMVAILMTGVRSVFGAVLATLVVYLIGIRGYRRLAALLGLFLAAGLVTGVFQARFDDLANPERALEWNSLTDREEMWYLVDLAIWNQPVQGYGLGSVNEYIADSPLRHNWVAHGTHCDYRKFAFEAGLSGGLLFALLWISVAATGWRARRRSATGGHLESAVAGLAIGYMVIAMVDEILLDYASMSLYWVIAGVVLGSTHPSPAWQEPANASEPEIGPAHA